MFDPAHQGSPLVRDGARIFAELIAKAEQMSMPGMDKPGDKSQPKAGPKFVEMPKPAAATTPAPAKPTAPAGPPSISTKPAVKPQGKQPKMGPPGIQIGKPKGQFEAPKPAAQVQSEGPPAVEAPKPPASSAAAPGLPKPPTVKLGGGPPPVAMPQAEAKPSTEAKPKIAAADEAGPPGIKSPTQIAAPVKKEPEQLPLGGGALDKPGEAKRTWYGKKIGAKDITSKPGKPTKPAAPGKEGEGEEKEPPSKIGGVRYANPQGPNASNWFSYGQGQGMMTTQAASAPGIVAGHAGRAVHAIGGLPGLRTPGGSAQQRRTTQASAEQRRQMIQNQQQAGAAKSLEWIDSLVSKSHSLPSLYLNSKLFPRGRLAKRDKSIKLPDPADENLQPDPEDLEEAEATAKAGAAQESGGRYTFPSEDQAKREEDSPKFPRGEGSAETPDLPERGGDWHGTVPGVPDVPEDSEDVDVGKTGQEQGEDRPKKTKKQPTPGNPANPPPQPSKTEEAIKALAGAPRFSPGPFVPPREAEFLLQYGYSPEEISSGDFRISPWMRAEFNRQQTSVIRKSINGLLGRISR
jgi:hypothetical protein